MSSKERLVNATAELLWQFGYQATSPSRIQQLAGVGQGSMYHHFDGKAGLAKSAMEQLASDLRTDILAGIGSPSGAIEALHAYLDLRRQPLAGCRMGRLVQDPDVVADDELRGIAGAAFDWQRQLLADAMRDGQRTGELRTDFDPEQVAAVVVAIVQGGYVQARAADDASMLGRITECAKQLVTGLAAPVTSESVPPEGNTP